MLPYDIPFALLLDWIMCLSYPFDPVCRTPVGLTAGNKSPFAHRFRRSEPMLSSQEMDDNNSSNDGGVYDTEAGYANDYANEPSNNSDSNSGPVGETANNGHGSGAAAAAAMADVDVGAAGAHAGGFGEGRDEVEVDLGEGREKVVGASAA